MRHEPSCTVTKRGCATKRTIDDAQIGGEREKRGRFCWKLACSHPGGSRFSIGRSQYLTGYGGVFDSFVFLGDIMIS